MTKMLILGLFIAVETSDDKEPCGVPAKRVPTLDELFAHAFKDETDEEAEDSRREKYGTIFA